MDNHRKHFALGLSLVATAITLASASATYSVNLESFSDWPHSTAMAFAILATVGIEASFALLLYGSTHAVVGTAERTLCFFSLAFLLGIMATNFTIHRQTVKGIPLSDWQISYYQWTGSVFLFAVVALVIAFKAIAPESRDRQMQRDIKSLALRRGLEWKKEVMESPAMDDHLDGYRQHIFADVRRTLNLPASTQFTQGAIAQTQEPDQPKTPPMIGFGKSAKYRGQGPKA